MSVSEQLDLFDFEEGDQFPPPRKKRRYDKANYRSSKFNAIPVKNGIPFVIVPEVAPLIRELCDLCAAECPPPNDAKVNGYPGVGVLAARAAVVTGKTEAAVLRRLYAIVHNKQLFVNANFIEGLLMAMDVEHEYVDRFSQWPSCRADALERVSIEAEMRGKKVSPSKLLARANRLYEKGLRKALKHAPEVQQ